MGSTSDPCDVDVSAEDWGIVVWEKESDGFCVVAVPGVATLNDLDDSDIMIGELDTVGELTSVSRLDVVVVSSRVAGSVMIVEPASWVKLEMSVGDDAYNELEAVDESASDGLSELVRRLDDERNSVSVLSDEVRTSVVNVAVDVKIAMSTDVLVIPGNCVVLASGIVLEEAAEVDNEAGSNVLVRKLNGRRPPVPQSKASTPHTATAAMTAKTVFEEPILTCWC